MNLPPYAATLGLAVTPGEDAPVFTMPFTDEVVGRPGFVHGGAIGGLLEMAAVGALIQAIGDDSVEIKPINLTIDFMRGGRDKPTFASGSVTRLGKRIANVYVTAWQDDPDRAIAAARMNFLLKR